jgi:hypothetical protein
MKQKPSSRRKRSSAKSVLRLPDLEHAKAAVLNSLNSMDAKRGYSHAIDEFVDWYCSEPRLAFKGKRLWSVSVCLRPGRNELPWRQCQSATLRQSATAKSTGRVLLVSMPVAMPNIEDQTL